MNVSKTVLMLLTVGTLALSTPVFAAGINQSTGRPGGGDGQNALAGNRANETVGDNPNATAPRYGCYRRHVYGRRNSVIYCPSFMQDDGSLATPTY